MRRFAVVAVAVALASATAVLSARHFAVVRSVPAKDSTVETSPEKLQVWFSQVPAAGVSQLKLGPQDDPKAEIEIGKTVVDAKDKSISAPLLAPLGAGAYAIRWRGAGDDGHVMTGEIKFTVVPKPDAR
jgi:methionine-rich copper-binding protein CopC